MFKARIRTRRLSAIITPLSAALAVVLLWELSIWLFRIPPYLAPRPSALLHSSVDMVRSLWADTLFTAAEAALGFLLANTAGFLAALLFAHSRVIENALFPYAILLKTTPIIAIAPLLVVWFGSGILSKVVVSALISFFPMLVNGVRGFRCVDQNALDLFETLNASRADTFFKLRLPSSLPYIFSALRISSSLAVVGAIVGEFVGAQHGLGYAIVLASYHLETRITFSAIFLSAVVGISMFLLVVMSEKKCVPWQTNAIV